jgi:DNA-binding transcriptional MerR regulator
MVYGAIVNGLRISELAERAGVTTSTVRYYERIGLVAAPRRTAAGYRAYDADAEARLRFITRAKRMGLSLDEIAELMGVWDGTNCGAAKERLASLIDDKRAAIARQIVELRTFEEQLAAVRSNIVASPTPTTCDADLGCCAPELSPIPVACTLPAGERPEREAAITSLFAQVQAWKRTNRTLSLRFVATSTIEADVARLTAEESACCAFLAFDTRRIGSELVWEITAPSEEAEAVLDAFAALIPGV